MYNVRPRMGWTTNWLGVEAQGSKWKSRGAAEIEGARVLGYVALDAHSSCLIAWKGSRVLKPTRPFGNVTRCCMARLLMLCLSQSICSSHHVTAQAGVFALLSSLLADEDPREARYLALTLSARANGFGFQRQRWLWLHAQRSVLVALPRILPTPRRIGPGKFTDALIRRATCAPPLPQRIWALYQLRVSSTCLSKSWANLASRGLTPVKAPPESRTQVLSSGQ